jgi:hypothetical protein
MTQLHAGRFVLRPFTAADAPAFAEAVRESMSSVGQWMSWAHASYTKEEALSWFAFCDAAQAAGHAHEFGIFMADGASFVGGAGLNQFNTMHGFSRAPPPAPIAPSAPRGARQACAARSGARPATAPRSPRVKTRSLSPAGQVGRAQRRRFGHLRPHHRHAQQVGLELHQHVVARGAAVGAHFHHGQAASFCIAASSSALW